MVRNYRFSINDDDSLDTSSGIITVKNQDLLHQMNNVLRLNADSQEEISFINGVDTKVYEVKAKDIGNKEAVFSIENEISSMRELDQEVKFYIPVIKIDAFEFMLRKLTELGVQNMVPVAFERSQKQNIEKLQSSKQIKRLEKIIQEATEQCEGAVFAELKPMVKFMDLAHELRVQDNGELRIYASERLASEEGISLNQEISLDDKKTYTLLIGPEGGLSDEEVKTLESLNFQSRSLGKRLLKAETAAIALFSSLIL